MSEQRRFAMDRSVTMEEALAVIRSALDDEGLALGPRSGRIDGVVSVIADGEKVFIVPGSRVMTREDDRSMRAAWAAQHAPRKEETT